MTRDNAATEMPTRADDTEAQTLRAFVAGAASAQNMSVAQFCAAHRLGRASVYQQFLRPAPGRLLDRLAVACGTDAAHLLSLSPGTGGPRSCPIEERLHEAASLRRGRSLHWLARSLGISRQRMFELMHAPRFTRTLFMLCDALDLDARDVVVLAGRDDAPPFTVTRFADWFITRAMSTGRTPLQLLAEVDEDDYLLFNALNDSAGPSLRLAHRLAAAGLGDLNTFAALSTQPWAQPVAAALRVTASRAWLTESWQPTAPVALTLAELYERRLVPTPQLRAAAAATGDPGIAKQFMPLAIANWWADTPLGERVHALTVRDALTTRDIAEKAGMTRQGVERVLDGRVRAPRDELIRVLARLLAMTDDEVRVVIAAGADLRGAQAAELRQRRENAGLTRAQVADCLGVPVKHLGRWESGTAPLPIRHRATFERITRAGRRSGPLRSADGA